jgi:photosynthetic reaction center cytochrome c subunit
MRVRVLLGSFALFVLTLVMVVARPLAAPQAQAAPQGPHNLQVLPKDMTQQQVVTLMRTFTAGLGVQCTYCHVQDRSLDDLPNKGIARKMIAMEMAINDQFLKGIGDPAPAGTSKVTCYTCHRGAEKPLTAAPAGGGQ